MGHNDRRRWMAVGDGFERAASGKQTWRVHPVGPGWRLDLLDPNAVGLAGRPPPPAVRPMWDAPDKQSCIDMVAHIERHDAYVEVASKAWDTIARPTQVEGITIHATRDGTAIHAFAVNDATDRQVGMFRADLSWWKTAWVLGEPTFDGGYSVDKGLIGKGVGLALFAAVEELAGVALTPHGQYGVPGSQSVQSLAFWEKRAKHRRIPGRGDPAVAARDAELLRVEFILAMASNVETARNPDLVAAMARATGWDVVYVLGDDGRDVREAWCVGPDGAALSGMGPDDGLPTSQAHESDDDAPAAERADAATYLALIEAAVIGPGGHPGMREEYRSFLAGVAPAACAVLERYAGVVVDPPALKAAILSGEAEAQPGIPTR